MSAESQVQAAPVASTRAIAEFYRHELPAKGASALFGVENEKLALYKSNDAPIDYAVMGAVLKWLTQHRGYAAKDQHGDFSQGLKKGGLGLSLEPGLQLETAGSPHLNLHDLAREIDASIADAVEAADAQGVNLIALAYQPTVHPLEIPQRPGDRYIVMHAFNDRVGSPQGHGMMSATATTQVSIGVTSEEDAQRKTRAFLNVGAQLSALFANSPFRGGGLDPEGAQSVRGVNNHNIMAGRYGFVPEAAFLDNGKPFFENIVNELVDNVPMMGYYRGGKFIDAQDKSFKEFLQSGQATTKDYVDYQKTTFPYVRVQPSPGLVEIRPHDTVPQELVKAMAAVYVGLGEQLDAVLDLTRHMKAEDRVRLYRDVPKKGLSTAFNESSKETVQHFLLRLLPIAEQGLKDRKLGEEVYLKPLWAIAVTGQTWSQRLTETYKKQGLSAAIGSMNYAANAGQGPSILKAA